MPLPSLLLVLGVLRIVLVSADQVSSSWRQPNITTSVADRISIAKGAIDEAISQIDTSTGQFPDAGDTYGSAGALFSQLAEFDLATNQSAYQDTLLNFWPAAQTTVNALTGVVNLTGALINDGLNYGHAAAMAYKVYKNPTFLQYAEQSWWVGNAYTISAAELKNGSTSVKNYTLSQACAGITMAGGTFRAKDVNDPSINVLSTGGFLVLSALLAETTTKPIYLDAAVQSLDFLHAHLFSIQNLVQDSIAADASQTCAAGSLLVPANQGLMLEGLAILYSITGNSSLQDIAGNIVSAALAATAWQGANGIITPGDLFLPRGLTAVYERNAIPSTMKSYVAAYLGVQFNAVTTLGRASGSNIYGAFGGPTSTFSPANQTDAISALIAAINADTSPSTSTTSSSGPASTSSDSNSPGGSIHKSSKAGPIAGGVIGGLLFLVVFLVILFLVLRRRRRNRNEQSQDALDSEGIDAYPRTRPEPTFRDQGATSSFIAYSSAAAGSSNDRNSSFAPSSPPASDAGFAGLGAYPPAPSTVTSHSNSESTSNSLTPLRSAKARMMAAEAQPSPPAEAAPSSAGGSTTAGGAQIPTDELVRLLYTRINGQPGTNEEAPPEYS
ncbi:hypothetical protein C8F01DRAFT_1101500 [Mycena amicta]|nr:hypothetical protein C8F01DRAFT_1101500 [Mycena amicta]